MNAEVCKLILSWPETREKPRRLAVAWSGGVDSTALLFALKAKGFDVLAWHIDHAWSGGSAVQAKQLQKLAEGWSIPFFTRRLAKPKQNIEAEARHLRYAAFADLAEETGCFDLALGHHKNDQAETVCMRLLQGAGIAGCQGMRAHRQRGKLNLWRPLLQMDKNDLQSYLQQEGIAWLEDPSNLDCKLWRNKIRHQLLPKMRDYNDNPESLFLRLQVQATRLNCVIGGLVDQINIVHVDTCESDFCRVDWLQWVQQQKPVQVHLLQKMLGILFADGKVLGRRHFVAIDHWQQHGARGWVSLSGCCLYRQGEYLYLCQGSKVIFEDNVNLDRG